MADTAGMSPEDAAAARAAEQARIRKERREAKIKAGGSARLNKITGLGGGIQRDPAPTNSSSRGSSPAPSAAARPEAESATEQHHADPEEIDISQHYYKPESTNRIPPSTGPSGGSDPSNMSDDQLRQMMLGFDRPSSGMGGGPGGPDADDPMMKMLQQMLGGGGGGPEGNGQGGANPFGPAGQDLFSQFAKMNEQQAQQQRQTVVETDTYTAIWRALHFILAMGLGLYVALLTGHDGTKVERERGAFAATTGTEGEDVAARKRYFFWAFATVETILLTSRFFLDSYRPPTGVVGMLMGFLPENYKLGLSTGHRYFQFITTVRSDLLVLCFALGIASWYKS